jgi:hypothetical protein
VLFPALPAISAPVACCSRRVESGSIEGDGSLGGGVRDAEFRATGVLYIEFPTASMSVHALIELHCLKLDQVTGLP